MQNSCKRGWEARRRLHRIHQFPQTFGGSDPAYKNDYFRFRVQAQRGARGGTIGEPEHRCIAAVPDGSGSLRGRAQSDRLIAQMFAHSQDEGCLTQSLSGEECTDRCPGFG